MSVRFIVDANLPPVLARALATQGCQAEHVMDVGLRESEDDPIWDYAIQHQAVIITKDEDFPKLLARPEPTPVVVWLRVGNCRNPALLSWFLPLLPDILGRIEVGDRLIEIR